MGENDIDIRENAIDIGELAIDIGKKVSHLLNVRSYKKTYRMFLNPHTAFRINLVLRTTTFTFSFFPKRSFSIYICGLKTTNLFADRIQKSSSMPFTRLIPSFTQQNGKRRSPPFQKGVYLYNFTCTQQKANF